MNQDAVRDRALRDLLARLEAERGIPTVDGTGLDAAAAGTPRLAVLFTAPRSPESWDVAVVLPELLRECADVRAVALDPAESARLAPRYGVDKYPSVVVLRDGLYTGAIEGMQDWEPFLVQLRRLADAEPRRPPSLRIPVVTEPSTASPTPRSA
jgi:hydrogenase-1 operon protein HyaE